MGTAVAKMYEYARERYAAIGVDADAAIDRMLRVDVSMHCWQGDDVGGFEQTNMAGGGIMATGNYPGRARTGDELRRDVERAMSLVPGRHRLNLHAIYAETEGRRIERDKLEACHFSRWIDWAREKELGLDFNGTFFGHPLAANGFTLANHDQHVRNFWIEHGRACRRIAAAMGSALGRTCIHNIWIPDGYKDVPADQRSPRERLAQSLDEILRESLPTAAVRDAVESKLFGLASESYVVGSHEFYLGYAIRKNIELCLDSGHFHPTESIAGKLSAVLCHLPRILLHISRGVRWDSDHVPLFSDEVREITQQVVRGGYLDRVDIAADWFDATINRIASWIIGLRNIRKGLLSAMLEPFEMLCACERDGDYTTRLALQEELKTMPFSLVWDYACERAGMPYGAAWLDEVRDYEKRELGRRA
ncbi:MAG: L-rhamnose isomerase [Kiritimatiellia bacterium]|nr:L-rhamnose isomerase [Lentisphaerota bacterium]